MHLPAAAQKEINTLYHGRKHIDLTIGILKDGKTETVHFGPDHTVCSGEPLIYAVGSICKPFTASLTAKLVSEGKLDLDAPLSQYISGLPDRFYPSLRSLATHTSGYTTQPYNLITTLPFFIRMNQEGGLFHTNPFRGYPDEELFLKILRDTRIKDRKYKFSYSNIGMSILGYIAGKEAGSDFWTAMSSYIRDDLQLSNTFLGNIDLPGYDRKDQPCRCWQWEKGDIIAPAGALNATAEDLLAFAAKNMDGSLPYTEMCHTVQADCDKDSYSGLAWRLDKTMPISWHGGNAGAFSAFLGFNRETKTAAAVAVNYGLVNAEQIGMAILRNEAEL